MDQIRVKSSAPVPAKKLENTLSANVVAKEYEATEAEQQLAKKQKLYGGAKEDEEMDWDQTAVEFQHLNDLMDYWKDAASSSLNIYQVASLTKTRGANVLAAGIAVLQLLVIPAVLIQAGFDTGSKGFCELSSWKDHWEMKMCGAAFLIYLAFMYHVADEELMGAKTQKTVLSNPIPMHPQMNFFRFHGQPSCANSWFIFGMYTNTISNYICGLGAILVLYQPAISPLPLNIVLNSVAISFIKNLDDDVVKAKDRKQVAKVIEEYKDTADAAIKKALHSRRRRRLTDAEKAELLHGIFKSISTMNNPAWDYVYRGLYVLGLIVSVIMYISPLWFFICY
jgi:hypothetical protein